MSKAPFKGKSEPAVWGYYGKTIRVYGNTFPIKDKLIELGGKFKSNYGGKPAWVFFMDKGKTEISDKLLKAFKKLKINQAEEKTVQAGLTTSKTYTFPKLEIGDKLKLKYIKGSEEIFRDYRVFNIVETDDIDIILEEDYVKIKAQKGDDDEEAPNVYNIGIFNGHFRFEFFRYEHSFEIELQRELKVDSRRKDKKAKKVSESEDENDSETEVKKKKKVQKKKDSESEDENDSETEKTKKKKKQNVRRRNSDSEAD